MERLRPGEILLRQGKLPERIYLIIEGEVEMYHLDETD